MKKLFASLILSIPLACFAQVKPGIPISEVVRQAQTQVEAQGKSKKDNSARGARNGYWTEFSDQTGDRMDRRPRCGQSVRDFDVQGSTRQTAFADQLDFDNRFGLSLGTNGLLWLAAIPNLDVRLQWDKFSLVGNIGYSAWTTSDRNFWWVTTFGAQLRYDIIPNVYVGVMYNWFSYNLKLTANGNQGVAQAVGAVAGYKLPIGRKLALDFGLGLGYALVDNEKYVQQGTSLVRDSRRTFGYWGLTQAQVALVWRIL